MDNKLKEQIEMCIDSVPNGLPKDNIEKICNKIYSLTADVAVKFVKYCETKYIEANKFTFTYFIENIYGK